jgi:hypothetical protein
MEKFQKPRNPEYYTQSSESLIIYQRQSRLLQTEEASAMVPPRMFISITSKERNQTAMVTGSKTIKPEQ